MNIQDLIFRLHDYWKDRGCAILQPYDLEKDSATSHPSTFFGALGDKPVRIAYADSCRRYGDARYALAPLRLGRFHQYQVLLKPAPADIRRVYLESLSFVGLSAAGRDIRWVEGDWESPPLGAAGRGWEVLAEGLEITHFTYFNRMGDLPLSTPSVEISYGIERLAFSLQDKETLFDLDWAPGLTWGDLFEGSEQQFSVSWLEASRKSELLAGMGRWETQALALLAKGLYRPAYDLALKCIMNYYLLAAGNFISGAAKKNLCGRIRRLTHGCAGAFLSRRKNGAL